ncbi:MAG TPA: fibronectin type III domain-containing protein [Gemmatimonadaceae bacterium]|nr:fibronectin type III domain-containing protein [Gemmatimonadaceae bacterium]
MSVAPQFRMSIAALALGASIVATTNGFAQLVRTRTGTTATPVVADPSTTTVLTTAIPAAPGPTGLAATGLGITAQVSWQPLAGVASYVVERWMESNPACCRVTSPTLTATSWSDVGLEWPGTYVYRVLANYADGRQGSAMLNFVRPTPQDPPAASFRAEPSLGSVRLSWSAVPGVTKYFVGGPGAGANGMEVTGTSTFLQGVPGGRQQWTVASMYTPGGLITHWRDWPTVSADMPYFGPINLRLWYENAALVDFDFLLVREATNLALFRGEALNQPSVVPWPQPFSRTQFGALDRVSVRFVFPDLKPGTLYQFYVIGTMPNGEIKKSEVVTASMPLMNVRATIPLSADRVIVEWNSFGSAPYTLEKGTVVQQGGGGYLAYDAVRDANGNAMTFTNLLRYDDITVQKGKTYYYKVCAKIPNGSACPATSIKVQ